MKSGFQLTHLERLQSYSKSILVVSSWNHKVRCCKTSFAQTALSLKRAKSWNVLFYHLILTIFIHCFWFRNNSIPTLHLVFVHNVCTQYFKHLFLIVTLSYFSSPSIHYHTDFVHTVHPGQVSSSLNGMHYILYYIFHCFHQIPSRDKRCKLASANVLLWCMRWTTVSTIVHILVCIPVNINKSIMGRLPTVKHLTNVS